MRNQIINHTWADGNVEVIRTCCSFEHPELLGKHVGDHGWKPYWIRIRYGKWRNVGHISPSTDLTVNKLWVEYESMADSLADFLQAIGFEEET